MIYKPIIALTMGDAAGVGPEIIIKTLRNPEVYKVGRPIVIGDAKILKRSIELLNVNMEIVCINQGYDKHLTFNGNSIYCYDLNNLPEDLQYGKISAEAGKAAFEYLKTAVELAKDNKVDAICTAPLNKEALHKGGHLYPGHTEILAELTNTKDFSMMLASPAFNVVHVTTHVGIIDAINMIEPKRVYRVIRLANDAMLRSGIHQPKIAVCGINPHAGENGLFGYGEEEEKIVPAISRALHEGISVEGPLPADTLFYRAVRGEFDVLVAMYHDQGHSPIKVMGLEKGVNITLGLPIIRTSVDHGTAFDIAGKGVADERSLLEAIQYSIKLASNEVTLSE